ncbi:MAG: glycoside hydrolase family 20 zincin-like fold domain-containing protein [Limisphaerales bacterium]
MPAPQKVSLAPRDTEFTRDWRLRVEASVSPTDVAVASLKEGLADRFDLRLKDAGQNPAAPRIVSLSVEPGSVVIGQAADRDRAVLVEQAYRIVLTPSRVRIIGNAPAGLFYGVQTFLQLLARRGGGLEFPEGEIEDWPDLQLRIIYWDDAHHLEHLDVLKAALRQAAFFKINGFAIKLEGHFQFRSAPAIMEPYVLTAPELQELTDYALRYHIQLIPYLDAPAHDAFILKHPIYAPLRAFPNCNYEFCVVNPQTYDMLFGLFQDLLDANHGAKYFVLSTDEPYYVGLAQGPGCDEAVRARELGSASKLLAEFISRSAAYLHERGRTVLFWGEYPLKPADIGALPGYLVNSETYGPEFDPAFKAHGIRQLIFTSTQGEEPMFPDYYPLPMADRLHAPSGPVEPGRVAEIFGAVSSLQARQQADLMGAFVAGWADAGLHPETFWLGYATGPAAAWHPNSSGPDELISTFFPLFYGADLPSMPRLYQLMSRQARFWDDSWETVPSQARTPIFGYSHGIFNPPHPAQDQSLPSLPVPSLVGLKLDRDWSTENLRRLTLARKFLAENQELMRLLEESRWRVRFNRYNLEVFLSIAQLYRENLEMLLDLERMDGELKAAQGLARTAPEKSLAHLDEALDLSRRIWRRRNEAYHNAVATWYQSWFPRVPEANGRRYLDQVDDVKDHRPVRTVDMSYLIYRELLYPLGEWAEATESVRNQFAQAQGLPARHQELEWRNTGR